MKPLYIFDLDGTLALNDHRKHFIADKKNKRWDEFYKACVDDLPNAAIINLLQTLIEVACGECGAKVSTNSDLFIFSGRSVFVKKETINWLLKYAGLLPQYSHEILMMRPHGDSTPDDELKKRWYEELSQEDKDRLVCVFDDRQKVVDMWRSIGVTCLQVAKGYF